MKTFQLFVRERKVIVGSPDPAHARALISQARERFKDLCGLPISRQSAPFRFEAAYEVVKEAIHAFLALEGYKPYSHEAIFSFAFERSLLTETYVRKADRYRMIRNDINYRATTVTIKDTKEILKYTKQTLIILERKFKN
ncbi:hypothetical protein CL622_00495 [archaeon]|nr:hypothetical protein [archaeon]|tara:strand:+ start:478 stop:897 length:420 start_codon:yes stop_codon:yes gene_type:complete